MSQDAMLYSSVALERADILALAHAVSAYYGIQVEDGLMDQATPEPAPLSGADSPPIRVEGGERPRSYIYIHFYKAGDEDLDHLLEKMTNRLGKPLQTALAMHFNDLQPVMEVAYAFADRWPCILDLEYKEIPLYDNAALFENWREQRAWVRQQAEQQALADEVTTTASDDGKEKVDNPQAEE